MILKLPAALVACVVSLASWAADSPTASREQLNAVLWVQTAAEYGAGTRQAYKAAEARLRALRRSSITASVEQESAARDAALPPAVVLDIDETVLDNTPYNATLVREGRAFDEFTWAQWVLAEKATAIPGAKRFLERARQLGFRIFFITNRTCSREGGYDAQNRAIDCPQKQATLRNLERELGFRPADDTVLLRYERKEWEAGDKTLRRMLVAESHRIAMLVGDDLGDFVPRADYAPTVHGARWGDNWFVIPNPIYGSWERRFTTLADRYAALKTADPDAPAAAKALSIVSWNMEWLADPAVLSSSGFWETCRARGWKNEKLADNLPFCDVYRRNGILSAADYEAKKLARLREALAEKAGPRMDLLAVQEVQGPAALAAVLPPDYRVACFTTRNDAQNVGYAVRISAGIVFNCGEIRELSLEDSPDGRAVRRGLELSTPVDGKVIAMLNVHLKASCPTGPMDNPEKLDCRTLQRQAEPLEKWVEGQAARGWPFIILGDWNRDLEAEIRGNFPARTDGSDPAGPIDPTKVRNLFPELNDKAPAASAMELTRIDRTAARGGGCRANLDQIVVSESLKSMLEPASFDGGALTARLVRGPGGASDHCAVEATLLWK